MLFGKDGVGIDKIQQVIYNIYSISSLIEYSDYYKINDKALCPLYKVKHNKELASLILNLRYRFLNLDPPRSRIKNDHESRPSGL